MDCAGYTGFAGASVLVYFPYFARGKEVICFIPVVSGGSSVAMGAVCKFDQCYFYENHAEKSKEFLVIEIVNTVGKSKEKNKRNGHQGLGLENVKEALKKYEGTCTIEQEDGEFRVILLIPDAREEEKA